MIFRVIHRVLNNLAHFSGENFKYMQLLTNTFNYELIKKGFIITFFSLDANSALLLLQREMCGIFFNNERDNE